MIKELKEKLAFKWAVVQVNKLERKSKKAYDGKGKWNATKMSSTLKFDEYKRWEELKKYVYSYRTRDSKLAKDLTRAKFNPKYGRDAGRPSIEDINYSLNEAPTDRPFKEDPPEKISKVYGSDSMFWTKTLPNGTVVVVSNEEYQEARKKAGLEPMEPWQYKVEVRNDTPSDRTSK